MADKRARACGEDRGDTRTPSLDDLPRAGAEQVHRRGDPYLDGYYSSVAQTMAARRRHRRRKLAREPLLLTSVLDRLRAGWSPEQIAGRLRRDGSGSYVCHETIYAWVYSEEGRDRRLARFLPYRRKKRRVRLGRKPRKAVFPENRSIHQRPDEVASREEFGHWGEA